MLQIQKKYWLLLTIAFVIGYIVVTETLLWVLLTLVCVWGYIGIREIAHPRMQNLALSALVFLVCGTLLEFGFYIQNQVAWQSEKTYSGDMFRDDAELGYGPNAGVYTAKNTITSLTKNELAYEANYTITKQYLRHIPGSGRHTECSIAFMGDSFTFGEGVQDDETMPFYFTQKSGEKFSTYNFGYVGYGPHQMLRTLETDRFDAIVDEPVDMFVYQGITPHVKRAAGKAYWDVSGPSYRLDESGVLRYQGSFDSAVPKNLNEMLQRSFVFRHVQNALYNNAHIGPEDVDLYIEILKQTRTIVEEKYEAQFTVVFWNRDNELTSLIMERLHDNEFEVILVTEIIPDRFTTEAPYILSPYDYHPNPTAHKLIGEYLANEFKSLTCK